MAPSANIVLGTASVGDSSASTFAKFDTPEQVGALLDLFHSRGHRQLDTARAYAPGAPGTSEARLGAAGAGERFRIDSKAAFAAGDGDGDEEQLHGRAGIVRSVDVSVRDLRVAQANIYYLHMPVRTTPLEETCAGIDEAYRAGKFMEFGVSNHTPEEVERIVRICEERGYVKPTVYQGQYNPIVRGGEKDLFPVLRKHKIAFYAYSPSGGGFFAGNHKGANTRFDRSTRVGEMYSNLYDKPELEKAFQRVRAAGEKHGISGHAAALRWTTYHSILDHALGDSVIIGASSLDQLRQNLDIIEAGPLPKDAADAVEEVFKHVGDGEIKPYF